MSAFSTSSGGGLSTGLDALGSLSSKISKGEDGDGDRLKQMERDNS